MSDPVNIGLKIDETIKAFSKASSALTRAEQHGWTWSQVTPLVSPVIYDETWVPAFEPYVFRAIRNVDVHLAPTWLVVLLESLVLKYRVPPTFNRQGKATTRAHGGEFVSMVVSWCAQGGPDALEGRAKPLASIICLSKDKADVERRVNQFINEVGF